MFTFLPKPIYEFITDYHLGGPLVILIGLCLIWLLVQSIYLFRFLNKRGKILRTICLGKSKIRIANPFWFFGFQKDKVDFYLLDGENIFAIKILGAFRPGIEFCFINETEYYRQRHIVFSSNMLMLSCGYGRKHTLSNIDFTYQCEAFGIDKEKIKPVLLWNPAPYCISAQYAPNKKIRHQRFINYASRPAPMQKNGTAAYHTGDLLHGKLLMDSHTLKKICKNSQT